MRARRTRAAGNEPAPCQERGRPGLLRLVSALVMALSLFLTSLAMSSGVAMAQSAPVPLSDMSHCIGKHETAPDQPPAAKISCAIACAAVQPMAPQMPPHIARLAPPLSSQPSPRLEGLHPDTTSPPPRLFPEV